MGLIKFSGIMSMSGLVGVKKPVEPTLIKAITNVGLTSGLQFALDAGDNNSYSGSGQKWLDTSGNGQDFFLGADASVDTDDPTFNGTGGGLSSNEFWTLEGFDFAKFNYDTTIETWMNDIHLDGATFTGVAVTFGDEEQNVFSTRGTGIEINVGLRYGLNVGTQQVIVQTQFALPLSKSADTSFVSNTWNFHTITIDENGGNVSFFTLNGAYNQVSSSNTFDATYTNTGQNSTGFEIGEGPFETDNRYAMLATWDTALTKSQIDDLFNQVRGRFGL